MLKTSGCVIAMTLIGCGSVQSTENPDAGIETTGVVDGDVVQGNEVIVDPARTFAFSISDEAGVKMASNHFATEDLAYLTASGAGAIEGDYYFAVQYTAYPATGETLVQASVDPAACRKFHVSAAGAIDAVAAANDPSCLRAVGVDAAGHLTVGIMPYELNHSAMHVDASGNLAYQVKIARFGTALAGPRAVNLSFAVSPDVVPPTAVCGDGHLDDGEVCDDGNLDAGDGCSASCHEEPCAGDHGGGTDGGGTDGNGGPDAGSHGPIVGAVLQ